MSKLTSHLFILLLCGQTVARCHASDALRTVALSGQPAPGAAAATFTAFHSPTMNDSGQIAFLAELSTHSAASWDGIWSSPAAAQISPVGFSGQVFADGSSTFTLNQFNAPIINNAGDVSFEAAEITGDGRGATVLPMIWKVSEIGQRQLIARGGQSAPGAPAGATFNAFGLQAVNSNGDVLFTADYTGFNRGLWSYDHSNGLEIVGRDGDTLPGLPAGTTIYEINGPLLSLNLPIGLNDARQTAFVTRLGGSHPPDYQAIFAARNRTDATLKVVTDDPVDALPGNLLFGDINQPLIRENGTIAFLAGLNNGGPAFDGDFALWSTNPGGEIQIVAQEFGDAPWVGGTADFHSFGRIAVAGDSSTAFLGYVTGGVVGPTVREGIFASADSNPLSLIAAAGQIAPGTLGNFLGFAFVPAINDAGQVAFHGKIDLGGVEYDGFWAQDRSGELKLIALEGQSIDVDDGLGQDLRVIQDLIFTPTRDYFNADGELVFHARFTDGFEGIFASRLVAVPEPTAIAMVALALAGAACRIRGAKRCQEPLSEGADSPISSQADNTCRFWELAPQNPKNTCRKWPRSLLSWALQCTNVHVL
jgi:hypothetical protein